MIFTSSWFCYARINYEDSSIWSMWQEFDTSKELIMVIYGSSQDYIFPVQVTEYGKLIVSPEQADILLNTSTEDKVLIFTNDANYSISMDDFKENRIIANNHDHITGESKMPLIPDVCTRMYPRPDDDLCDPPLIPLPDEHFPIIVPHLPTYRHIPLENLPRGSIPKSSPFENLPQGSIPKSSPFENLPQGSIPKLPPYPDLPDN